MNATQESVEFKQQAALVHAYVSQGEWWKPKGRPIVRVVDMDRAWRRNAARWMERRAAWFELMFSFGEAYALSEPTLREVIGELDNEVVERGPRVSQFDMMSDLAHDAVLADMDARCDDPVGWLRSTPLYRALVDGIPEDLLQGDAPEWML